MHTQKIYSRLPFNLVMALSAILSVIFLLSPIPAFSQSQSPQTRPTQAAVEKLSPEVLKRIRTSNKSFKECQKQAVLEFKAKRLTPVTFKTALDICSERFPASSLYADCKRNYLKKAKDAKLADQETEDSGALNSCKTQLTSAAFDSARPLPFYITNGQLFFSGVGLNKPVPIGNLDPPDFTCERVNNAIKKTSEAEYLLFGNHPTMFKGFAGLKGPDLAKVLKYQAPAKPTPKPPGKSSPSASKLPAVAPDGVTIPGLGKLFGSLDDPNATLFFPMSPCEFSAETGSVFKGLSAHFLLDPQAKTATPYFGIAYYKPLQHLAKTSDLLKAAMAQLGPGYKPYAKGKNIAFIAAAPLTEFDDEKDPKNLCRAPRSHPFLVVVQAMKDHPAQPEYLVVAHIQNLCEHGDRLAQRLTNQ